MAAAYPIRVQEPYFTHIREGRKTIEGRLNEGKWKAVAIGDIFQISKPGSDETFQVKVIWVAVVDSIPTLYRLGKEQLLPGVKTPEEAQKVYAKFGYTPARQAEAGVIGFGLRLL